MDRIPARLRQVLPTLIALVVVAAAVGIGTASSGSEEPGPGEAHLELGDDATVLITRADGSEERVRRDTRLGPGDRAEVEHGEASMRFRGGIGLGLRAARPAATAGAGSSGNANGTAASEVVVGEVPVLEAGEVLVTAGERPAELEAAGTAIRVAGGAARVSRSVGVRIATYSGDATVESAGQGRTVAALRQILVPALGRVPSGHRALAYDRADPWDRRHLGAAIDFGERLENLGAGYSETLPDGLEPDGDLLRELVDDLAGERALDDLVAGTDRDAGDLLVGSVIAALAPGGTFDERWDEVFDFRDLGARWGLVALDQGLVEGGPITDAVELAIGASPDLFAEAELAAAEPDEPAAEPDDDASPDGEGEPAPPTAPPGTTPPTGPSAPPGPAPAPAPAPAPGSGSGTQPPPPPPPPPPTTTTTTAPINQAGGTVREVVGDVTDRVGDVSRPVTETVDGLVGGLLGN